MTDNPNHYPRPHPNRSWTSSVSLSLYLSTYKIPLSLCIHTLSLSFYIQTPLYLSTYTLSHSRSLYIHSIFLHTLRLCISLRSHSPSISLHTHPLSISLYTLSLYLQTHPLTLSLNMHTHTHTLSLSLSLSTYSFILGGIQKRRPQGEGEGGQGEKGHVRT